MKKTILSTLVLVTVLLTGVTNNADAASSCRRPTSSAYIGAGFSFLEVDYTTDDGVNYNELYEKDFGGVTIFAGTSLSKYVDLELGYSQFDKEYRTLTTNIKGTNYTGESELSVDIYYADIIGRHRLYNTRLAFLGSLGIAHVEVKDLQLNTTPALTTYPDSDTALRAGLGFEYAVSCRAGVKGMAHYMDIDMGETMNNIVEYTLAITYKF